MFRSSDKLSNIKNGEFLYNGDKASQFQPGNSLNTKKKCLKDSQFFSNRGMSKSAFLLRRQI